MNSGRLLVLAVVFGAPTSVSAKSFQLKTFPAAVAETSTYRAVPYDIEVAARQPIASRAIQVPDWARLAQVEQVKVAGESYTIAPADVLSPYLLMGGAEGHKGDLTAFCAAMKVNAGTVGKAILGSVAFGLLRGATRSRPGQVCLVDRDADGQFDGAFHSGAQRGEDLSIASVGPFAYQLTAAPFGIPALQVIFEGTDKDALVFGLRSVSAEGKPAAYERRATIRPEAFATPTVIQGVAFTVLSYDKARKVANVRVTAPVSAGPFAFKPVEQRIYVPIYVPR